MEKEESFQLAQFNHNFENVNDNSNTFRFQNEDIKEKKINLKNTESLSNVAVISNNFNIDNTGDLKLNDTYENMKNHNEDHYTKFFKISNLNKNDPNISNLINKNILENKTKLPNILENNVKFKVYNPNKFENKENIQTNNKSFINQDIKINLSIIQNKSIKDESQFLNRTTENIKLSNNNYPNFKLQLNEESEREKFSLSKYATEEEQTDHKLKKAKLKQSTIKKCQSENENHSISNTNTNIKVSSNASINKSNNNLQIIQNAPLAMVDKSISQIDVKVQNITPNDVPNCRICYDVTNEEKGGLISPCTCTGTCQFIHESCLKTWIENNFSDNKIKAECEICKFQFKMKFYIKHRFSKKRVCTFLKSLAGFIIVMIVILTLIFTVIYVIVAALATMNDTNKQNFINVMIAVACSLLFISCIISFRNCKRNFYESYMCDWKIFNLDGSKN